MLEKELQEIIVCGQQIIQIISTEFERIDAMVIHALEYVGEKWQENVELYKWNVGEGLLRFHPDRLVFKRDESRECDEPSSLLEWYQREANNCLLIIEDFYPFFEQNPQIVRIFRNIARSKKEGSIILSQPFSNLPKELEKDTHIITLDLPSRRDLEVILKQVYKNNKVPYDDSYIHERLIDSALGLTIMQARKIFSRVMVHSNNNPRQEEVSFIIAEKERIIKNSGFLEYYHHSEKLTDVGGLENLKDWLKKRGLGFVRRAREYGLEIPKGVLFLGIPGTGKSLCAKAVGNEWGFPTIKLDMGRIFGGIVGESESNIRQALQIAESLSPCILWIDEIEKGFSGLSSSSSSDGGTTSRVLGTFLSWMQDKKKPVFVVATANNISQLPPELLRKGRIDEIFFVDLPAFNARKEIISLHLKKVKREPSEFDLDSLSEASRGFSGAEIEEGIKEALFQAYSCGEEIKDSHILKALGKTYPISKTMSEVITSMRKWARARALFASSEEYDGSINASDDIPKLAQESIQNPFIS